MSERRQIGDADPQLKSGAQIWLRIAADTHKRVTKLSVMYRSTAELRQFPWRIIKRRSTPAAAAAVAPPLRHECEKNLLGLSPPLPSRVSPALPESLEKGVCLWGYRTRPMSERLSPV